MAIEPVTREEQFLAAAGGRSVSPPTPITRKEQLLQGIIDAVQSGGATPDVIENAVNKYLDANPVKPGATTEQAAQIEQNKTDIADLQTEIDKKQPKGDYVKTVNGNKPDASGNVVVATGGNGSGENVTDEQVAAAVDARLPDIIDGLLDKMNIVGVVDDENNITIYGNLESGTYTLRYEHEDGTTTEIGSLAVVRDDTGEEEPDTPEKTLSSITAGYTGGDVAVGTALSALTGVVVIAHYSDGTSEPVAGYTLSGTIAEGNNIITATYQSKTATFIVTGVSGGGGESGSDSNEIPLEFTLGKINSSTGEITDDASYAYSNLIEITEGNKYEIVYTDISATIKICYYDDSGNFISCSAHELADAINSESKQISGSVEVPIVDGAAYFRIRSYLYYFSSEGASFELLRNGTKLTVAPSEEGAV